MGKRFFSDEERGVIYEKSGGKCQSCGIELYGVFEADHVIPYSKGGLTNADNGQALCSECNKRKSNTYVNLPDLHIELRDWQEMAFDIYKAKVSRGQRNVVVNATPGAGKTWFGLYIARDALVSGFAGKIVVIVPTDELRFQWQREASMYFGIELASVFDSTHQFADDYHGIVTTYATIAARHGTSRDISGLISKYKTIAIVDEIHHVAESLRWGASLESALITCKSRLIITGTPFRSDRNRIPFVEYVPDGSANCLVCKADYSYGYGQALRDNVVRPVFFQTFDGDVSWLTKEGDLIESSFDEDLPSRQAAQRLRMAIHAKGDWLSSVLKEANSRLVEMRREDVRAAGLIVAKDTNHAWAIASLMNEIGIEPIVVTSKNENGEPDEMSSEKLSRFRDGDGSWIIAVKMVSEGVDIKRLRIGVWATNIQTEMFFRQVVGRILRVDSVGVDDQYALQYIPKLEPITVYAEAMKNERHHVIDDLNSIDDLLSELSKERELDGSCRNGYEILVGNAAYKSDIIYDESLYSIKELDSAKKFVLMAGETATEKEIVKVAKYLRLIGVVSSSETSSISVNGKSNGAVVAGKTLEGRKQELTKRGGVLSRLTAAIVSMTEGAIGYDDINREMNRRQGVTSRKSCTEEQLLQRVHMLKSWREACDSDGRWRELNPARYLCELPG